VPFWKIGLITLSIADSIFTYKFLTHKLINYEEINPIMKYTIEQIGIGPAMIFRLVYIFFLILMVDYFTNKSKYIKQEVIYAITFFLYVIIYASFIKLR